DGLPLSISFPNPCSGLLRSPVTRLRNGGMPWCSRPTPKQLKIRTRGVGIATGGRLLVPNDPRGRISGPPPELGASPPAASLLTTRQALPRHCGAAPRKDRPSSAGRVVPAQCGVKQRD